jgi:hypothetical protein
MASSQVSTENKQTVFGNIGKKGKLAQLAHRRTKASQDNPPLPMSHHNYNPHEMNHQSNHRLRHHHQF